MAIYALVMPILGLPVFLFAIVVFLVALDLISPETIPLATSPRSFSVAFWLFAHNLMEAMGIMTVGALYVLVPRYTRSGKLYAHASLRSPWFSTRWPLSPLSVTISTHG
jgi:cytochrome c oxidase subunit 1